MGVLSPCLNITTTLVRVNTFGSGGASSFTGIDHTELIQMHSKTQAWLNSILSSFFVRVGQKIKNYKRFVFVLVFTRPFLFGFWRFNGACKITGHRVKFHLSGQDVGDSMLFYLSLSLSSVLCRPTVKNFSVWHKRNMSTAFFICWALWHGRTGQHNF